MTDSVSEIIKECESTARTALQGCPAAAYAVLTPLLERAVALSSQMNSEYPAAISQIIKSILEAQQCDDLIKIADFLNFELVYVLRNFQKN